MGKLDRAIRYLSENQRAATLIRDAELELEAEQKRHAIRLAADTAIYGGKGKAVSDDGGKNPYQPVLTMPIDRSFGSLLRSNGMWVPKIGEQFAGTENVSFNMARALSVFMPDVHLSPVTGHSSSGRWTATYGEWLTEILITFGYATAPAKVATTDRPVTRHTVESSEIPDKPSMVAPLLPFLGSGPVQGNVTGAYGRTTDGGTFRISRSMVDALSVFAPAIRTAPAGYGATVTPTIHFRPESRSEWAAVVPDSSSDAIWQAIESIAREGFKFPARRAARDIVVSYGMANALYALLDETPETIMAHDTDSSLFVVKQTTYEWIERPFNGLALRRAIDAAWKTRKAQFQPERLDDVVSQAFFRAYAAMRLIIGGATADDIVTHSGDYFGAIGEIAGVIVDRETRCGKCASCVRQDPNVSRYSIRGCIEPKPIRDFMDMGRVLSVSIYGAAANSVSAERYAVPLDVVTEQSDDTFTEEIFECGHGVKCSRMECRAFNVVHSAHIAATALGIKVIGDNGRVAREFLNLVSAALSLPETERGRRAASQVLRDVLGDDVKRRDVVKRVSAATDKRERKTAAEVIRSGGPDAIRRAATERAARDRAARERKAAEEAAEQRAAEETAERRDRANGGKSQRVFRKIVAS